MVRILVADKKNLENAMIDGLRNYLKDFSKVGNNSTEEALRYLVTDQLRRYDLRKFGSLPNKFKTKPQLLFEYPIPIYKSSNQIYKPDIASIGFDRKGEIVDTLFTIELKIQSEKRRDFNKSRNYVSDRFGDLQFQLAIIIDLFSYNRWSKLGKVKKAKESQANILWVTTDSKYNIYSRWFVTT
jgi:hypothetical protein